MFILPQIALSDAGRLKVHGGVDGERAKCGGGGTTTGKRWLGGGGWLAVENLSTRRCWGCYLMRSGRQQEVQAPILKAIPHQRWLYRRTTTNVGCWPSTTNEPTMNRNGFDICRWACSPHTMPTLQVSLGRLESHLESIFSSWERWSVGRWKEWGIKGSFDQFLSGCATHSTSIGCHGDYLFVYLFISLFIHPTYQGL